MLVLLGKILLTVLGVMFGILVLVACIGAVFLNVFDKLDDEDKESEV